MYLNVLLSSSNLRVLLVLWVDVIDHFYYKHSDSDVSSHWARRSMSVLSFFFIKTYKLVLLLVL